MRSSRPTTEKRPDGAESLDAARTPCWAPPENAPTVDSGGPARLAEDQGTPRETLDTISFSLAAEKFPRGPLKPEGENYDGTDPAERLTNQQRNTDWDDVWGCPILANRVTVQNKEGSKHRPEKDPSLEGRQDSAPRRRTEGANERSEAQAREPDHLRSSAEAGDPDSFWKYNKYAFKQTAHHRRYGTSTSLAGRLLSTRATPHHSDEDSYLGAKRPKTRLPTSEGSACLQAQNYDASRGMMNTISPSLASGKPERNDQGRGWPDKEPHVRIARPCAGDGEEFPTLPASNPGEYCMQTTFATSIATTTTDSRSEGLVGATYLARVHIASPAGRNLSIGNLQGGETGSPDDCPPEEPGDRHHTHEELREQLGLSGTEIATTWSKGDLVSVLWTLGLWPILQEGPPSGAALRGQIGDRSGILRTGRWQAPINRASDGSLQRLTHLVLA